MVRILSTTAALQLSPALSRPKKVNAAKLSDVTNRNQSHFGDRKEGNNAADGFRDRLYQYYFSLIYIGNSDLSMSSPIGSVKRPLLLRMDSTF